MYRLTPIIVALALSAFTSTRAAEAPVADDTKKYEPPPVKPEDILPGTTKQFKFSESRIFPGTVRDVTVFIPAQYDGKKAACVWRICGAAGPSA